jgi:hypothetical protein
MPIFAFLAAGAAAGTTGFGSISTSSFAPQHGQSTLTLRIILSPL